MADETSDPASRTEDPSAKRLADARERGDVAKSPDVAPLMALAAVSLGCLIYGGDIARAISAELLPFISHPEQFDLSGLGSQSVLLQVLRACAPVVVLLLAAAVAGVAGNLLQTGFIWAPSKLQPDFSKLNPISGLARLFGIDGLAQTFKSLLKLCAVGLIAWYVIAPRAGALSMMAGLEPAAILPVAVDVIRQVLLAVLAMLAAVAGIDWFWQRQRFIQRMRMSKEEVKQENKDLEGDPHVKLRRRQIQFQRARQRMMQAVPTATVVVMNPTHYAVALRYVQGETAAPECVAKGVDSLALRIRDLAREHGVPVIENPPLARALYATVKVDETIPTEHFEAVARIIGFILAKARERARPARPSALT
jgi:flagellar biosynthesis protein FlhB